VVTAFIGLGSNLGDRRGTLRAAVGELGPGTQVAPLFATSAVGGPEGQPEFLNTAARIETSLPPRALLARLTAIERALGRVRGVQCGPRTIDLDLLLYAVDVVQSHELTVPHPRIHERGFVLAPLAELARDVVHPGFGLTIRALYAKWVESGSGDRVVRIAGPEWADQTVDLRSS